MSLFKGDVLGAYEHWGKKGSPTVIISDGAYGIGGFPGDPKTPDGLGQWYEPHVEAWSKYATPQTALWFWNTELGWAETHSTIKKHGWKYVQTCVWNKGIGHIAGNVNSETIRRFPVTTEIAVLYQREPVFARIDGNGEQSLQDWMRSEWKRTGLPFSKANEAAGVKNAASRKWLAGDHMFYPPPAAMFKKMIEYANVHGSPLSSTDEPYFNEALEMVASSERNSWDQLRYQWNHVHGITNVWDLPPLRSKERLKLPGGKSSHPNQKPLEIASRIIEATSTLGDIVWEPFGGTGAFAYAAEMMGRKGLVAETNPEYQKIISERLDFGNRLL